MKPRTCASDLLFAGRHFGILLGALVFPLIALSLAADPPQECVPTGSVVPCRDSGRVSGSGGNMIHLAQGQKTVVTVCSHPRWNYTNIAVRPHQVYDIEVRAGGVWKDGFLSPVTACGYDRCYLAPFRHWRRHPEAPWFELIGGVGTDESQTFRVGAHNSSATINATGELTFYANDVWRMYWNNKGAIEVTVRLVRDGE